MSETDLDAERLARRAAAALRGGDGSDAAPMARLMALARDGRAAEAGWAHDAPSGRARLDAGSIRWRMGGTLLATLAAGILIGLSWPRAQQGSHDPAPFQAVTSAGKQPVQFVFVAPAARRVSLVGEFNGWNPRSTPMTLSHDGKVWAASLDLAPGRHVYAFLVDDSTWVADPQAPIAPEAWYGGRKSVLVVADGSNH